MFGAGRALGQGLGVLRALALHWAQETPPHPTFGETETRGGAPWPVGGTARVGVRPRVQASSDP